MLLASFALLLMGNPVPQGLDAPRITQSEFKKLVAAYQNKEVADFIEANFKGAILPAW